MKAHLVDVKMVLNYRNVDGFITAKLCDKTDTDFTINWCALILACTDLLLIFHGLRRTFATITKRFQKLFVRELVGIFDRVVVLFQHPTLKTDHRLSKEHSGLHFVVTGCRIWNTPIPHYTHIMARLSIIK